MPRKILAIRFQALGDVMITLPYLQSLRNSVPEATVDFLTRREVGEIPEKIGLFNKVIRIGGGRNARLQFLLAMLIMPYLWWQRYDVVVDLQNHKISRIIRFLLSASSWSEFDRGSKITAGERTQRTLQAIGVGIIGIMPLSISHHLKALSIHFQHGWKEKNSFVILNPAGAFITRNWPLENYISFARDWMREVDGNTFFVILGPSSLAGRTAALCHDLNGRCIDLSGKTTPFEAFSIVGKARFMLTEDSGLMHMAWIQRVPTLALFGSSPAYWSAPLGSWSRCLSSTDLPCGNCFSEHCQYGDVHCLTRFTPAFVMAEALSLCRHAETTRT